MNSIVCFIIVVVLGIAMFIYGGYDDSPGGQLLGAAGAFIGIRGIYKQIRSNKS